ncbi:MAG: DUF4272 domain-containing protein, partial [Holophagales bacterium]|nr:DUF4272 domain-containing protein [Holophagales bacterium]
MLHFFSCRPHALTLDELGNLWPGCRIADTRANPGVVAFSARWPDKAARLSRLAPEQLDLALHDLLEQLRLLALAGGDVLPDLPAMLQRSQFLYALELGAGWAAPGVSQVAVPLASATASLHEVGPYLLDPNGAPLLHRSAEGEPAAGPDLFSAVLLLPGPEIPSAERIRAWLPAADVGIDEDGDTVLHYGEGRSVALIHLRDDAYDQYLGQARQVFAYQSAGEPRRLEGRVAEVLAEPGQVLALQSQSIDRPTYLETLRVLAEGLDPVVFFEGVFEDVRRRPLFVPPEPDPEAPSLPNQEPSAPATERQLARRERSRARLAPKAVPEIEGHDLFVPDDREVELRTPQEAAKRAMILAVVALRAQGFPMTQLEGALVNRHHDLRPSLSPEEQAFLAQDEPDPEQAEMLVWRHESVQPLLFALGHLPA